MTQQQESSEGSADPLAVFRSSFDAPDHPGRCPGMGLGATLSKVYGDSYFEGGSSQYSQYKRTLDNLNKILLLSYLLKLSI